MHKHGWKNWSTDVPAEIHHSYLVRMMNDESQPIEGMPPWSTEPKVEGPSVTAIFQPVARDEFGALTVAWKVIETH